MKMAKKIAKQIKAFNKWKNDIGNYRKAMQDAGVPKAKWFNDAHGLALIPVGADKEKYK